ncbi:hypothetical protein NDU88_002585 [Pleurodeles waltl]|uniref:Uncharacterized protein n=1 Tax=Pleurodeles waltl TaxID=8319 RepID=A0AAV7WQB3_PLEWA|nr:hypothetical protein NDU88_002585 [Pleurodeles waltl]
MLERRRAGCRGKGPPHHRPLSTANTGCLGVCLSASSHEGEIASVPRPGLRAPLHGMGVSKVGAGRNRRRQ